MARQSQNDIVTRILGEDKTGPAAKSAKRNLEGVGDAAKKSGTGMRDANRWAGVLAGGLAGIAAAAGIDALTSLGKAAYDLGKQASGVLLLKDSFSQLATQAGASSTAMLDAMRSASRGMIADSELVLAANKAMLLGVADDAGELARLLDIARVRGGAMGLSMTQAFDNIVTGLGRGSALILDNLGITVDLDRTYRDYAATLGKTASALTVVEQKQALVSAVLKDSANLIGGQTTEAQQMAASFAQAEASIANMKQALGELFAPAMAAIAQQIADAVRGVTELTQADPQRPTFDAELYRLQMEGLRNEQAMFNNAIADGVELRAEDIARLEEVNRLLGEARRDYNVAMAQEFAPPGLMDGAVQAALNALAAEQAALNAAMAEGQAYAQEFTDAYSKIGDLATKTADKLLPELGPKVFGQIDEWGARWKAQFDVLIENGYTADQALKIIAVDADRMGDALLEAASNGALDELTRDAIELQGGLAGAALLAERLLSAGNRLGSGGAKGGKGGALSSLFDLPGGNFSGYSIPKGKATWGTASDRTSDEWERFAEGFQDFGTATADATDAVSNFASMLSNVPGLFGESAVTDEQMRMGELGVPQNFADDYLRRLTDEVLNGVDWQDVDIASAAAAIGVDAALPAEAILELFRQAWNDSSLFANPENLKFLNADAVKAAIEKMQQGQQGEDNLRALFGLGDEKLVDSIAGLGLQVQDGIAGWLQTNGLPAAGEATAAALGAGVKDNGAAMGGGVATGLFDWIASDAGASEMERIGQKLADGISKGLKLTPALEAPAPGGLGAAATAGNATGRAYWQGGYTMVGEAGAELAYMPRGARIFNTAETREALQAAGGQTVNVYATVAGGVDINQVAYKVADVLRRRAA